MFLMFLLNLFQFLQHEKRIFFILLQDKNNPQRMLNHFESDYLETVFFYFFEHYVEKYFPVLNIKMEKMGKGL